MGDKEIVDLVEETKKLDQELSQVEATLENERRENLRRASRNGKLKKAAANFMVDSIRARYSYNFDWLGRPIIQYPQDIIALQEIIWKIQPDLIIETGIARGGSLIFSASMLELIGGKGRVLGIDVDIRLHNRIEIEKHGMFKRITMIEGSSLDQKTIARVRDFARGKKKNSGIFGFQPYTCACVTGTSALLAARESWKLLYCF